MFLPTKDAPPLLVVVVVVVIVGVGGGGGGGGGGGVVVLFMLFLQMSNTPCLGAGTGVDEEVTRGFAFGTAIGRRLFFLAMHNVSTESPR